jgi:hypothetical protein
MMRSQGSRFRAAVGSIATFTIILVVGIALTQLLQSFRSSRQGSGPIQAPETVLSERVALKPARAVKYDLALTADARVKIDVRSVSARISVKLVSTPEPVIDAERPAPEPRTVFWHHDTLTVIRVESLTAGKWTILIERSDASAATSRRDTMVTTEVTVL